MRIHTSLAEGLIELRIIPQALSVRYGLSIGAFAAPGVLALMYIFGERLSLHISHLYSLICAAPVAYPIAKLLDRVLGASEATTYKKAELKSFLQFHRQGEEPLRDDEISILNGVLELNNKHVEEIMTPMKDVVTLSADTILDHKRLDAMYVPAACLAALAKDADQVRRAALRRAIPASRCTSRAIRRRSWGSCSSRSYSSMTPRRRGPSRACSSESCPRRTRASTASRRSTTCTCARPAGGAMRRADPAQPDRPRTPAADQQHAGRRRRRDRRRHARGHH
jgi:hypothetical protein